MAGDAAGDRGWKMSGYMMIYSSVELHDTRTRHVLFNRLPMNPTMIVSDTNSTPSNVSSVYSTTFLQSYIA